MKSSILLATVMAVAVGASHLQADSCTDKFKRADQGPDALKQFKSCVETQETEFNAEIQRLQSQIDELKKKPRKETKTTHIGSGSHDLSVDCNDNELASGCLARCDDRCAGHVDPFLGIATGKTCKFTIANPDPANNMCLELIASCTSDRK